MDEPGAVGARADAADTTGHRLLADDFTEPIRPGRVIGSTVNGHRRGGRDVEGRLGVDGGALRIAPLRTPGWGRCSLAYGPFPPDAGLAAVVHVSNGHHASESYGIRSMRSQMLSWLRGSHTRPIARRVPELLTDRRRLPVHRRLAEWIQHWRRPPAELLGDNLAVGFFTTPAPTSIADLAAAFLVRGTGVGNGELTAHVGADQVTVAERITNIPLHLVVVVREDAVTYFAGSLAGAHGAGSHPMMRPLAVADGRPTAPLHLGVEQNVLGEIGFSVDTRVYGARVVELPGLGQWPGTALAADRLHGNGALASSAHGHPWEARIGGATRTEAGLRTDAPTLVLLDPGTPTGLVRLRLDGATGPSPSLVWRADPRGDHLRIEIATGTARLVRRRAGQDQEVAHGELPGTPSALEVTDDDTTVRVRADGSEILVAPTDPGSPDATAVGLLLPESGEYAASDFEAHPREVPIPAELRLAAAPWRAGEHVLIDDDFTDERADLDGRAAATGRWARRIGHGRFAVDGEGLVVAEAPDRTAYTVPWPHPEFADVTARIVPRRTGKHRSRAGVIFLQDPDNFVIVNLWFNDRPDGAASVSSFFRTDGREEVYDAVWVNVGDRVQWDRAVDVRAAFDGDRYHVALDGEPVLWRAVRDVYPRARPLAVREVGVVANWEWGLDTGSRVLHFTAATDRSVGRGDDVQHG